MDNGSLCSKIAFIPPVPSLVCFCHSRNPRNSKDFFYHFPIPPFPSLSLTPGRLQRNLFSTHFKTRSNLPPYMPSNLEGKYFLETTEPCTDIIVCKNLKECSNMCDYIYILMILMRFWVGLVLMTHTRCVTTSGAYLISFVWPPLAKSAAHYQIKDDRLKWQIAMFSCSTWSPSASWREPPMPRPWSYLQLGFRLFFVLISCNLATPGTNPKLSLFAGGGGGDGSSTRLSHIVRKSCWGARVTSSEKAGEEDAGTLWPFLI